MKKLFFIMAMSVCAFTAQAQTTSGIRVGLNIWGIERSGFFNGREKWAKDFENQRV